MTPRPPGYVAGLDLGQASDHTALIVVETQGGPRAASSPTYDVRHIERIALGTRYPAIAAHAVAVVAALAALTVPPPRVTLVVDYTGVGRPVADMIVAARPRAGLALVTIHGGDRASVEPATGELRVPKRDLAATVQRLLQEGRLRIPAAHPLAPVLESELTGFRVTLTARGHDSYAAPSAGSGQAGDDWRSAPHDDLVLALALACWWAEQRPAFAII
jgi:hypothetical protein